MSALAAKFRRAEAFFRVDEFNKAIGVLLEVDIDDEVQLTKAVKSVMLEDLHLMGKRLRNDLPDPLWAKGDTRNPIVSLTADGVYDIVRKMCHAVAPGHSGWTEELVCYLLQPDSPCRDMVADLIKDICNGNVSGAYRDILCLGKLIGLTKPESTPENPKLRPIGISEAFLKIAGKVCMARCRNGIRSFFGELQLGVGYKGGCEKIIHEFRELLKTYPFIATIDASNAFNEVLRKMVRATLLANRELLERGTVLEYGSTSILITPDGIEIVSSTGTRQGGSTAGLLFAIGLHPVLRDFFAKFPDVKIKAYLDDINLACKCPLMLAESINWLEQAMGTVGLRVNRKKSWWLGPTPPPEGLLEGFQFADSATSCIRVVGGFIGADAAVKEALMQLVRKCDLCFVRLAEAPKQMATGLLAKCVSTKMTFLLRTHAPHLTQDVQDIFDRRLLGCLADIAEINPTETTKVMMALPARMGGLGFPRCSDIAAGCYAASKAFACDDESVDSQQKASAKVHTRMFNALCEKSVVLKAVLEDFSRAGGGWITMSNVGRFEPDDAWSASLRARLNCTHRTLDDANLRCPGGIKGVCDNLSADEFVPHVLGCTHIKGYNCSSRHTALKLVVAEWATKSRVQGSSGEPREFASYVCPLGKQKIFYDEFWLHAAKCAECDFKELPRASGPDARFRFPNFDSIVVDYTFMSMANKTHRGRAPFDVFDDRRGEKMAKYGDAVDRAGESLVVFGVSASGALSSESAGLCRLFESVSNKDICRHEMGRAIKRCAAICAGMILQNAELQSDAVIDRERKPMKIPQGDACRGSEHPMVADEPAKPVSTAATTPSKDSVSSSSSSSPTVLVNFTSPASVPQPP